MMMNSPFINTSKDIKLSIRSQPREIGQMREELWDVYNAKRREGFDKVLPIPAAHEVSPILRQGGLCQVFCTVVSRAENNYQFVHPINRKGVVQPSDR